MSVPDVIERYVRSAAAGDLDTLVACFDEDAVVADDGATMVGRAAIRAWREALLDGPAYTSTVLASASDGENSFLVTTFVEGDFPGSPVELQFQFTVVGDLISALTIAP